MHIRFDRTNRLIQQLCYLSITQFFEIIATYCDSILFWEPRDQCLKLAQVFPVFQELLRLAIVLYFKLCTIFRQIKCYVLKPVAAPMTIEDIKSNFVEPR